MSGPWIAAFAVLACVVLLLSVLMLGLLRRVERLASRLEVVPRVEVRQHVDDGVRVGESVSFVEFDNNGRESPIKFASALMVFGSHGCGPCERLREELIAHPLAGTGRAQILVWEGADAAPSVPGWRTVVKNAAGLRALLRIDATPYCVVTDEESVVLAAGVPGSAREIQRLLDEAAARAAADPSRPG